jgi:hypothetical protein
MKNSLVRSGAITVGVLLIPFLTMQFTQEVDWDSTDFIIMGILIFGTSFVFDQAMKKIQDHKQRIITGLAIIVGFLYVWAELAVGIFTNLGS